MVRHVSGHYFEHVSILVVYYIRVMDNILSVTACLASSLLFTCNPKQLARLSTLLASFTTTVSSSSLLCAREHQVGNELYRRSYVKRMGSVEYNF